MAQNNPKTISSSVGWSSSSKSKSSPFKFPLTQPQTLITFGATTFESFDTLYWWTKYDSPAPKIRKPHSQSLKTWNTTVFLSPNMQKPLLPGHRHPQCHPPAPLLASPGTAAAATESSTTVKSPRPKDGPSCTNWGRSAMEGCQTMSMCCCTVFWQLKL